MSKTSFCCLLAMVLALANVAGAHAQGIGETGGTTSSKSNTVAGGTATSGTGVKTGQGPLSQPIPPATSSANPRQNLQQGPQRPLNMQGPAQTNPPQQPFGTR
jgi:hypothetical protein